jgi:hypothetical protein
MKKIILIIAILFTCVTSANAISGSFVGGFSSDSPYTLWQSVQGKWKLANETFTDISGNNNILTAIGTPNQYTGHGTGANLATYFDNSTSEYLSIADGSQTGLDIMGNISMSAWIYISTSVGNNRIITKGMTSGHLAYDFFVTSIAHYVYCRLSNDGTTQTAAITPAISLTAWHHVACVYNGTDIKIYVDGSLASNGSDNPKTYSYGIANSDESFNIAQVLSFTGIIDDVAIWNRALSETEITYLSNLGDDFGGL